MKTCLSCSLPYQGLRWECPNCAARPAVVEGFPTFAPDLTREVAGYSSDHYDSLETAEEGHFWFAGRRRLILWALAGHFPDARSFFEVGCGSGYVLAGLQQMRADLAIAGSEVLLAGLHRAAKRLGSSAQLFQMDARRLPFSEEFDVIGAFDVIEHIVEDEAVLSEMYRACRPGGGIILTVPQHPWLWSAMDDAAHHIRRYSATDLRAKIEAAGFVVERMTSFVATLLPALVMKRLLQRRECDLGAELSLSPAANWLFGRALSFDEWFIRHGVDLPVGGSLLAVARKTVRT